jgi:hypothetical protein
VGISEDRQVIGSTLDLIALARRTVPRYAMGSSSAELSKLFIETRTQLVERRFESTAKGMAYPDGATDHVILVDSACQRSDQVFTIRHEFAHILAGEVQEALYLTAEDTMAFSERRADLFAIVDITPASWMRGNACDRRGRLRKHAPLEVVGCFRMLTDGWSEQRLWDRARLRVTLYREHGI